VTHGGSLAVAVIERDAGIGKTALLPRLADGACEHGVVVVRATAHPLESAWPYGGLEHQRRAGGQHEHRASGSAELVALLAAEHDLAGSGVGL
jgi:hypothetical protein